MSRVMETIATRREGERTLRTMAALVASVMVLLLTLQVVFGTSTSHGSPSSSELHPSGPSSSHTFPHIPWEVIHVAARTRDKDGEYEDGCKSLPGNAEAHDHRSSLLLLLFQGASGRDLGQCVTQVACSSRLAVHADQDRWPPLLVTVRCGCEFKRCGEGGFNHCVTVLRPVRVMRRSAPGASFISTTELLPVGCVCAMLSAKQAQLIEPIIT